MTCLTAALTSVMPAPLRQVGSVAHVQLQVMLHLQCHLTGGKDKSLNDLCEKKWKFRICCVEKYDF